MNALYRAALGLLPASVRQQHGEQMAAVFDDLLTETRRRLGWRGAVCLLVAELLALARFGWKERRQLRARSRIDDAALSWALEPDRRRPMFASLAQDVRYAVRTLRHAPAFTLVSVATMALAIGANTAIFSVVNGVLLEGLPYADAERIVVIGHRSIDGPNGAELSTTTPGNFSDWQSRTDAFESMAAFAYTERAITLGANVERVRGVLSAGSVFDVLGRSAAAGRTFTSVEDGPGAPAVVVIADGFARKWFGARVPVGESIGIGGVPYTVIGVMPADFTFPDRDAEYWIPARFAAAFRGNRDQYFLQAVARLKPGVDLDQAEAQVNTVMDAIRRDYPQFTQDAMAGIVPAKELLVGNVRTRLLVLMAAVVVILLIACANLGSLLLARAAARRREIAVRQALGARPYRLVQQLVTEALLLSAVGGAVGVILGYALLGVLVAWLPTDLPRANQIGLDRTVMVFSATAALVAGLIFGAVPAFLVGRTAPIEAVREGTRGSAGHARTRTALVVAEVALAVMLLAGAGLLVRSFARLVEVNPGFQPERILTFRVGVPGDVYRQAGQRLAFFDDLLERTRQLPGVRDAAIGSYLPVTGYGTGAWLNRLDRPTPADRTPPSVAYRVISPNYFQVIGIPLIRGRLLTTDDRLDGTRAVVISEAAARRFWPDEDPIGKRIYLGAPDNRLFPDAEVVGIVGDVTQLSLDNPGAEAVYATHRLMPSWSTFSFAIRAASDPALLTAAIREQLRQLDPSVPMFAVRSMEDVIAVSRAPARSSMLLVGSFAALALVLAVIGIVGLQSYMVSQRATELGIRIALGASAGDIRRVVVGRGLVPVAVGLGIGTIGALASTRLIESLLFGVSPTDPVTFAAVASLLIVVAAAAAYFPARRATRLDPRQVLRET